MRSRGVVDETNFCLSVIGGDPEVDPDEMSAEMLRLQNLRNHYELQDMVALLGKRSQDSLPSYYSASKVVVVPSHYESFGMVALEAMACGTHVVDWDVGGLAYLVKDGITGYTVPVGDPEALAERLTQLLLNPHLRDRMANQAADNAREYAWELIVERLLKVYAELLGREVK